MARHLRLEYEGAIYHITSRGNERGAIFSGRADCARFLDKLGESVGHFHVRLYAYVLMTNHYHLLVETPRGNLAAFMQQLNTSYTMYYNTRHQRVGHLFSGRYKAPVVQGDRYLLQLARYIHLNPIKIAAWRGRPLSDRLAHLRAYPWSSHRGYAGLETPAAWMDCAPLLALVSQGRGNVAQAYRTHVEGGVAVDDDEFLAIHGQSSQAIGDREFCRHVAGQLKQRRGQLGSAVDVVLRRVEVGIEPQVVLSAVCGVCQVERSALVRHRDLGAARLLAALLLRELTGLNQREIAQRLGLRDGSGLGRMLRHASTQLKADRHLRQKYKKLLTMLRP